MKKILTHSDRQNTTPAIELSMLNTIYGPTVRNMLAFLIFTINKHHRSKGKKTKFTVI